MARTKGSGNGGGATREEIASASSVAASKSGMIHIRVLKAKNLPTMDFGKRQEPVVKVRLEGSIPKQEGKTDPAFQGGTNPEWTEYANHEIELFFDENTTSREDLLTFEVYADDTPTADLIGLGQIDVTRVVRNQQKTEEEFIVRLKDSLMGSASRGEVTTQIWFGPPLRKAFRAAQRASKLLDARDCLVSGVCAGVHGLMSSSCKYCRLPAEYLKKNKRVSVLLAAALGVLSAGALAIFTMIAVPTGLFAAFTFPFWILPFLTIAFFTSPLWVPVLLLVGGFVFFIATFCLGLGVTSRPIRRKGAFFTSKIKKTEVGQRVAYEKEE